MISSKPINLTENLRPVFATIRTVPIPPKPGEEATEPAEPFITIARQAGAGGWTFARQLVEALNAADPSDRPWTCWDKELVEKVAADHHLSNRLIEALDTTQHRWMSDFLSSLSFSDSPEHADEAKVYRRVSSTVRALAKAGRVIIVGRGGVFLTRHLPGGIHLFLVAPEEYRVQFMARQLGLDHDAAVAHVHEMERNRRAFYKRHWPEESMSPELFTLTMNAAELPSEAMIEVVKQLVPVSVKA